MYKKIKQGDVELPIVAFCINGYNSQKIELIIKEVIGCPYKMTFDNNLDVSVVMTESG